MLVRLLEVHHLVVVHPSWSSLALDHFPFLLVVLMEVQTYFVEVELTSEAVLDSYPLVEERTYLVVLSDLEEVPIEEASSLVGFQGSLKEALASNHPLVELPFSHP
jgi:hypothetical protein